MIKKSLGQLAKYTLLEEIGSGGFGTVYKAHDPALDRHVALKVLLPHLTQDATTLERFRQEAKQAARLKHPNIVTVYEVAESEGRYYIVMEFLEGQPLSEIIKDEGPLPPQRAIKIIQQVGDALDYAHGEGLIHRDVKPSNILVGKEDKATLTDFGIVKAMGESGLTTTGTSMGTPEYMAPEQITGEEPDSRMDLYALGVVAFHILTGRVPFTGTTPYAIQKGHTEEPPPDPKEINPALGDHISEAVLKAMSKKTDDRFQFGGKFSEALAAAVDREEGQYWEKLYLEAQTLMEKRELIPSLEKWKIIQNGKPNFRDVNNKLNIVAKQIDLDKRYKKLGKKVCEAKDDAFEILKDDSSYPDSENLLSMLISMGETGLDGESQDKQKPIIELYAIKDVQLHRSSKILIICSLIIGLFLSIWAIIVASGGGNVSQAADTSTIWIVSFLTLGFICIFDDRIYKILFNIHLKRAHKVILWVAIILSVLFTSVFLLKPTTDTARFRDLSIIIMCLVLCVIGFITILKALLIRKLVETLLSDLMRNIIWGIMVFQLPLFSIFLLSPTTDTARFRDVLMIVLPLIIAIVILIIAISLDQKNEQPT